MRRAPFRPLLALVLLWAALLTGFVLALQRPRPLFVNVGAGDGPFARGFRERWERDGVTGSGETMFRWAEDGSRLEVPLALRRSRVRARLRLARFTSTEAEVALEQDGREVDRWRQPPSGWRIREVDLGEVEGPVRLAFRAPQAVPDRLVVAVDWVEVHGVGAVVPPRAVALRLLLFLAGPPLIALACTGRATLAAGVGAFAAGLALAAVTLERLAGLWACAEAALPAVVVFALLGMLNALMRRSWPDSAAPGALVVPLLVALVAVAALFQPFYHYPDVDTHGRFLQALRANPTLLVDPTQPWPRRGDVTREIGGQNVALPYAMVFHAAAWPLAPLLGDAGALKTIAIVAAGAVVLLVHPLARAAALDPGWAVAAQALCAVLPVTTSRLTLALYPTLFGQAFLVLLLVHLARRLAHLDGARDAAAATFFILAAQAAYTGSLIMVSALVLVLSGVELARGEWRRALRLLGGWGVATLLLLLTMYVGFLPRLWSDVLPHLLAGGPAPAETAALSAALTRLGLFYDLVFPALVAAGLAFRPLPTHVRRVLGSAVAAGLAVLVARYVFPTPLRDAKDVELLAAPVSVLAAAGVCVLSGRGRLQRAVATIALVAGVLWALGRDVALYAERFVAVGRGGGGG